MKILFLDFETTGLEEGAGHVPIEVAARLVTPGVDDAGPHELGRTSALIRPLFGAAARADSYAMAMHKDSRLFERAQESGVEVRTAEKLLLALIAEYADDEKEKVVLAGNSIHFDRRFVKKYMPELHNRLHYHMLDITAVSIFQQLFGIGEPWGDWKKKKAHTADADLDETWQEAEIYARNLGLLTGD